MSTRNIKNTSEGIERDHTSGGIESGHTSGGIERGLRLPYGRLRGRAVVKALCYKPGVRELVTR
jgi:hypothetical protein